MRIFSVTQDNPEGIDRYLLCTTKELADKVASSWVDEDNDRRREMCEASGDYSMMDIYEWRWLKEREYWAYGSSDQYGEFHPIYTIMVSEVEVYDEMPKNR